MTFYLKSTEEIKWRDYEQIVFSAFGRVLCTVQEQFSPKFNKGLIDAFILMYS